MAENVLASLSIGAVMLLPGILAVALAGFPRRLHGHELAVWIVLISLVTQALILKASDTSVTKALRLYHQVQNASSPLLYASSVRTLAGLLFAWIALSIAAGVFSGIVLSRTRRWWEPVLFWLVGEKATGESAVEQVLYSFNSRVAELTLANGTTITGAVQTIRHYGERLGGLAIEPFNINGTDLDDDEKRIIYIPESSIVLMAFRENETTDKHELI